MFVWLLIPFIFLPAAGFSFCLANAEIFMVAGRQRATTASGATGLALARSLSPDVEQGTTPVHELFGHYHDLQQQYVRRSFVSLCSAVVVLGGGLVCLARHDAPKCNY